MSHPALPASIGPYRPLDRLGAGGFGEVFLARDDRGRMLAVKVLHAQMASQLDDHQMRVRLRREVETMEKVRHPRVAEIVDFDLEASRPYLVMRYVEGMPLDVLLREGPLKGAELRRLARGLAEAIAAIHLQGCIHRDIKPSNVILTNGDPVVIDFGIAHQFDATRFTTYGATGTMGYMAPELINNERPGPGVDVFAWAVTVAYAATGVHPFRATNDGARIRRILNEQPDLAGAPAWLTPVLSASMAKDPDGRPTAAKLVELLTDLTPRRGADLEDQVEIEPEDVPHEMDAVPALLESASKQSPRTQPLADARPATPPPWPQPMYAQPMYAQPQTSGAAMASLVVGVVGVVVGWCTFGIPCVIAIILGHIGLAQTKDGTKGGRGLAVAGLILGYLILVITAMYVIVAGVWSLSAAPFPAGMGVGHLARLLVRDDFV
ncbi:hypothetical protein Pth03_81620 [Planotetraspora thailandica]|uniref:Protein kinase domain-containing protein n=1 Tax=Planotetraspora thailandica TaxID=487172 RepID=A0A8J4DFJ3_9ACTN|nr:protein kinase [Planotetraspora thailandica]GII59773.1 hypothetical protein Pth03_81620 [Planotetraspora thailandica]